MRKNFILPALTLSLILSTPALANANASEKCFGAGFYKKMLAKTSSLGAQYRDVVNADMMIRMHMEDGASLPERFIFRQGGSDTDLPILADGTIPAANQIADKPDGEFCIIDPRISENSEGKMGVSMNVDSDVLFLNSSGTHTLTELTEGAKDGKKFYKKMYGAMASLVSLSHVMIDFEDDGADAAQISATKDGAPIAGLNTEEFYGTHLVSLKALKKMGADGLSIRGGAYTLSPVPNKKTLEKYFGE